MSIRLLGVNPETFFGASAWEWEALCELTRRRGGIGEQVVWPRDEETLADDFTVPDGGLCRSIAARLESFQRRQPSGHAMASADEAYEVPDWKLAEWIEFLRTCGGFRVAPAGRQ